MFRLAPLGLTLLLTACPPPPPPVADVSPPTPPAAIEAPDGVVEPASPAALSRSDLRPTPLPDKIPYRLLGRFTLAITVAPDGDTYLQLQGRKATIRSFSRSHKVALPSRLYTSSRFSPDSRHLVLADESGSVTIASVAKGKVLARISGASDPRWISAAAVGYRRGCIAMKLELGQASAVIGEAPAPCSNLVNISSDYERWIIADQGRYRRGVYQSFVRIREVDLVSGAVRLLVEGDDDAHLLLPRASRDGRRLCFADANFDLFCQSDGVTEAIWRNIRRPMVFDDSGDRLLFAVGKPGNPDSRIVVVDFIARTTTTVPQAGREWWRFLPGGKRIAGHGGSSSAIVYDLDRGWQAEIGDRQGEWEGLWVFPGDPRRLALGRERGATRDVFLATLPD